jgi:hypothetical protein
MAEFRRASEDFKKQWEKEVELEDFAKTEDSSSHSLVDASLSRNHSLHAVPSEDEIEAISSSGPSEQSASEVTAPEIREVEPAAIANAPVNENEYVPREPARKRDWL